MPERINTGHYVYLKLNYPFFKTADIVSVMGIATVSAYRYNNKWKNGEITEVTPDDSIEEEARAYAEANFPEKLIPSRVHRYNLRGIRGAGVVEIPEELIAVASESHDEYASQLARSYVVSDDIMQEVAEKTYVQPGETLEQVMNRVAERNQQLDPSEVVRKPIIAGDKKTPKTHRIHLEGASLEDLRRFFEAMRLSEDKTYDFSILVQEVDE